MTKTVLITGGTKGIGKVTALQFAEKKYQIVVNYRSDEKQAEQFASKLSLVSGKECKIIKADISTEKGCESLVSKIKEHQLHIDILIHNAGPYISDRKKMTEYSFNEWSTMINGNLNAVFHLSKAFIPHMREQKWGRIITYGFDRAETAPGWMYRSAFAAAKSGLVSLTKTISMEEAENGITANMVCPGDITGEWKEKVIESAQESDDHQNPVGRPGTGEDLARMISFLCDDHSDFVTGAVIPVTGGKDVLGKVFRDTVR
ncbi:SDR family oxidoreductase [Jeotgalibacillus sp. R-1-5s-1]|uniref:SDR family oxidoreductase n=1 Tax=Jeotgalibacillus sp. R-1-5s-1 TaxID=2555897 RepID=UPI00106D1C71|nr:SDR family oxidoreductase [Jeotgalibacillus sp. R-1-5s-1]TFE03289.1 SDR family oxidoreductase [Jeotgalibacillus sp. R-1-5s-1]